MKLVLPAYEMYKTVFRVLLPGLLRIRASKIQKQLDGSVQDCNISTANALEILQFCIKSSKSL